MRHRRTILILLLGLLCTLAYLPSLNGPLLEFDDTLLITNNPAIRAGADGLKDIWQGQTLDYFPVTNTLFWIEWHAGGSALPQVFRIVNLALHLTAAGLLAYLVWLWGVGNCSTGGRSSCRAETRDPDKRLGGSLALPMIAGAIWMLHPLNVASVAWVSEQKNTLAAVLALASCIAYTKSLFHPATRSRATLLLVLSLVLFILSLLAKPAFVALPLILLVMIWWRFRGVSRRDIVRLMPLLAVAIASACIAVWFQARHVEQIGNDAGPIATRIARAGSATWFYLGKMIAPVRLSPIYPRWSVDPSRPSQWLPLIALIVVLIAIALARRRGPIALLLIGLLLLAPVVGLANSSFFRLSYVADHWTYPALMAFAVALAIGIGRLPHALQLPVALVLVLCLLPLTWRRARAYHDTLSLWEDAASKVTTNYAIYNNLAWAYLDAGRADEAVKAAERAAQLAPDEPDVQQTLVATRRRALSDALK